MQIKNTTNRSLEFEVASKSSVTLWTGSVASGAGASKDLSDGDAPFTLTSRWAAMPPLQWNFVPPGGTSNVPNNKSTVTITDAFPSFFGSAG